MTEHSDEGSLFSSLKFGDWPTVKEALIGKKIGGVFILAPLAMQLVADGVPIKVVYLGHRDGTGIVVGKDSPIHDFGDLRGKVVAIPSRYANQNILMHRMMDKWGMPHDSIELRELPPPEHPTALRAGAIDAYIVGEPFAAKAEVEGFGRVLYHTKDIWPDFISCVLVVREDLIDERRELIQELVDGIAKSGKWLDEDQEHRMEAAEVSATQRYFNQDPELLKYVLSKPVDRVKYTNLAPLKDDFDEIMELAADIGVLSRRVEFTEYVDDSFVRPLDQLDWELDHLPLMGEEEAHSPPNGGDGAAAAPDATAPTGGAGSTDPAEEEEGQGSPVLAGLASLAVLLLAIGAMLLGLRMSAHKQEWALPATLALALTAGWDLSCRLSGTETFPTPFETWSAFLQMTESQRLWGDAVASLFRVTWGFFLAAGVAIPLGLVIGWSTRAFRAMNPIVQGLRPVSPIAWIPISILWFGIGDRPAIFLIFLSSFFPICVGTTSAVRNISLVHQRSARNFGVGGIELFRRVVLPAALPQIITSLRIALGVAWLVIVAAEMVGMTSGLGYLITDARNAGMRYDQVVATMILIGLLGIVLDLLIRRLEHFDEVRWGYVQR
ncbi:MAG: ABC transporter substrate-binding protein [Planctomycetota bacterium]|nr:ABC transporter substrate-binding protein [Planctomycetota bacterium]